MAGLFNIFKDKKMAADLKEVSTALNEAKIDLEKTKAELVQSYTMGYPYFYAPIIRQPFTGEKNPGEMGAVKNYYLDYIRLRGRSWQSFLESEVTQTVVKRYLTWVIGSGLKVQPEPDLRVLKQEGINFADDFDFINTVDSRFKIWSNSRFSDYAKMDSVQKLAYEAYKHALIGGDCLCIYRIVNKRVTCQLIDGYFIMTPWSNEQFTKDAEARGNTIEHGVEITPPTESLMQITTPIASPTHVSHQLPFHAEDLLELVDGLGG